MVAGGLAAIQGFPGKTAEGGKQGFPCFDGGGIDVEGSFVDEELGGVEEGKLGVILQILLDFLLAEARGEIGGIPGDGECLVGRPRRMLAVVRAGVGNGGDHVTIPEFLICLEGEVIDEDLAALG